MFETGVPLIMGYYVISVYQETTTHTVTSGLQF